MNLSHRACQMQGTGVCEALSCTFPETYGKFDIFQKKSISNRLKLREKRKEIKVLVLCATDKTIQELDSFEFIQDNLINFIFYTDNGEKIPNNQVYFTFYYIGKNIKRYTSKRACSQKIDVIDKYCHSFPSQFDIIINEYCPYITDNKTKSVYTREFKQMLINRLKPNGYFLNPDNIGSYTCENKPYALIEKWLNPYLKLVPSHFLPTKKPVPFEAFKKSTR
jgi:hypothetical protein